MMHGQRNIVIQAFCRHFCTVGQPSLLRVLASLIILSIGSVTTLRSFRFLRTISHYNTHILHPARCLTVIRRTNSSTFDSSTVLSNWLSLRREIIFIFVQISADSWRYLYQGLPAGRALRAPL